MALTPPPVFYNCKKYNVNFAILKQLFHNIEHVGAHSLLVTQYVTFTICILFLTIRMFSNML